VADFIPGEGLNVKDMRHSNRYVNDAEDMPFVPAAVNPLAVKAPVASTSLKKVIVPEPGAT